ncbi:pentatricopeptide repeat-containing protein At1g02370, mitochondrial-like [Salvia miltiorrhiza]|uniref:pentatricopeptide repeat-containing protein At1g02370, mitochondrial-like n=1 Tax=Salvia miltiorrhiza TaxID=226208 RepID=UPI0025AD1313|nr:pentatricopeptide repeat-containing protein At1g02370, mitochondrial-like [Salvia miltiorrhiza]
MVNPGPQLRAGASALVRIFSAKPRAGTAAAQQLPALKQDVSASPQPEPLQQEVGLYRRLSLVGCTDGEVANAINEYTMEGKVIKKTELEKCIKDFHKFKRYSHALEVGEWMAHKFILKNKDIRIHLDAVVKVKGIAAAENYFNDLCPSRRVKCTYAALLNCYCTEEMSDKAVDLFSKMVEQNMIDGPLPFNHLMMMYIRLGEPEKVIRLGEEMKKANIQPNTSTCSMLMSGYSLLNDLEGVERVLKEMKAESKKLVNWKTYSHLANIYIKAGDHEKARLALQGLEEMRARERDAYHFMISLYAQMNDRDNVHRVWKSLKSASKVIWNTSYLIMIRSLDNLDDIEGLKECFEEWEKVCSIYDVRLPNTIIRAYLRHDMLEEAESVLQRTLKRSEGPFLYAWEMFMNFYLKRHGVKEAMKIMETATSKAVNTKWKPTRDTIDGFLDCFKLDNDATGAEEFYELMKRMNCVDTHFYESLLRIYAGAGQNLPDVRARVERDGVKISTELQDLIASVSLE